MIDPIFIRYTNGDRLTDGELTELGVYFGKIAELVGECPNFFGSATIGAAYRHLHNINTLIKARKDRK